MQAQWSRALERYTYCGRGPGENYSDRKEGSFMGVYSGYIKDFGFTYIYPQENGNRCDVRYLSLYAKKGGVAFIGGQPLSVSVWSHTQQELDDATHTNELLESKGAFTVNIDCAQSGVGGTDAWSIKSRPSDAYRLLKKHYTYSFVITPVKTTAEAAQKSCGVEYKNQ
jgi:beta-galactosidase